MTYFCCFIAVVALVQGRSMAILLREAGRACGRLYWGNRALTFLPHLAYSSSSDSQEESTGEARKDPLGIEIVSYAPKPQAEPPADGNAAPPPRTQRDRRRDSALRFHPQPSETQEDSNARPWTREESRYMKDMPTVAAVSYPARVAPLPEDRVFQEETGTELPAQSPDLGKEARRLDDALRAKMAVREEEADIPFPKIVRPEKKGPKLPVDLQDAIRGVKANARCKFDETVEAHVVLGVNPKRGDQIVRGAAILPHGLGKTVRVAVFAEAAAANEARAAGADIVGGNELIDEIKDGGGKLNFDKCIATPAFMPRLGKIARILGPKGLMPNPKVGTVTNDISDAVREAKTGRVDFKMDKTAIVHAGLGKVSYSEEALRDNIAVFINALLAAKPVGLKKTSKYAGYVNTFTLCSTMGPGFRVSIQSLAQAADQYMKLRVQ